MFLQVLSPPQNFKNTAMTASFQIKFPHQVFLSKGLVIFNFIRCPGSAFSKTMNSAQDAASVTTPPSTATSFKTELLLLCPRKQQRSCRDGQLIEPHFPVQT